MFLFEMRKLNLNTKETFEIIQDNSLFLSI